MATACKPLQRDGPVSKHTSKFSSSFGLAIEDSHRSSSFFRELPSLFRLHIEDVAFDDKKERMSPHDMASIGRGLRCSGDAADALQRYQRFVKKMKSEGKDRPYAHAYMALKDAVSTPTGMKRKHGDIDGVPIGLVVNWKGEAAILGLHCNVSSGIDSVKGQPCYAISISGDNPDDNYDPFDGTIIYSGSGGKTRDGKIIDQTKNSANESLMLSQESKKPIRVLQRTEDGDLRYKGLYRCTDWKYEKGVKGNKVYKFTLEPMPGKEARDRRSTSPKFLKAPPTALFRSSNNYPCTSRERKTSRAIPEPNTQLEPSTAARATTLQVTRFQVQEFQGRRDPETRFWTHHMLNLKRQRTEESILFNCQKKQRVRTTTWPIVCKALLWLPNRSKQPTTRQLFHNRKEGLLPFWLTCQICTWKK